MGETRRARRGGREVVLKENLLGVLFMVLSAGIVVGIVGGLRKALKKAKLDQDNME